MQIISISNSNTIAEACLALNKGELVIYPTETCYGLGADATNEEAIKRLLAYKGGRGRKPISIAVSDQAMAQEYVALNEVGESIFKTLLPGPVMVVGKSKHRVGIQIESERNTLGVRYPDYDFTLRLIKAFGKPITSTSANTSNKKAPYSLKEWEKYTSQPKIDQVTSFLDAGQLPIRPPSTIVDTTLNVPTILRQGEVSLANAVGAETLTSESERETQLVAGTILRSIKSKKPIVLALQGELGAGKTQFAKGVAEALKISETVNSPTYTICKEYRFGNEQACFYHIDAWRLDDGESLQSIGLDEMMKNQNVIVIEWMQKAHEELIKLKQLATLVWVTIDGSGDEERIIRYQIA